MSDIQNYEPCFAVIPDDWAGRWKLLREFTRRWHGIPVGDVGRQSPLIEQEEAKLERTLPPSFREWISFAEELIEQEAFDILRDCYEVEELEDHPAISLMIQGEADVYWAVREENLDIDDPPVDIYPTDYGTEGSPFVHEGELSPSITCFLLQHMAYYLHGRGGGMLVTIKQIDELMAQMHAAFPVASHFGNLHIFEKENVIALLFQDRYDHSEYSLIVEIWKPIPRHELPECIYANSKHGGAFHGMLIPDHRKR